MPDATTVFIGTGIPMLAASLAQKIHAPNLIPIFEFGGVGALLEELPMAVGEYNTFRRALVASGICDIVETASRGFIEYGFLGGAQIDPYGNLNSTVIGDYHHPKVRLPGSGGANDVGSHCWRTIIIMRHDRRRFVEKVDFITGQGYLTGGDAREKAGIPKGGPRKVVTNLCIMDFEPDTKAMRLVSLHPGVTLEQVKEATGFELIIPEKVEETAPPTKEELEFMREIDPKGVRELEFH